MGDFFKIDKDRFARAFAYNTGSPVDGTGQIGNIAYEITNSAWQADIGGLEWWNGPEERNAWIIGKDWPAGDWNTPIGDIGDVHFWKTNFDTLFEFRNLANNVAENISGSSWFTSSIQAKDWLDSNGYFTNFVTASWMIPEYEDYPLTQKNIFKRTSQSLKVAIDTRLPNSVPYSQSAINSFICGMQGVGVLATSSLDAGVKISNQLDRIDNSVADPDYGYAIFEIGKAGALENYFMVSDAFPGQFAYRHFSNEQTLGDDLTIMWVGFRPQGIGYSANGYHSNPYGFYVRNWGLEIKIAAPDSANIPATNMLTSIQQLGGPNFGDPSVSYLEGMPAYNTLLMRGIRCTKTGGVSAPFTYDIEFIKDGTLQNPSAGGKSQQISWSMDYAGTSGPDFGSYMKMNSTNMNTTSQGADPYATGFLGFFVYRSSLSSSQINDIWTDFSSSHAAKVAAFDKDTWPFPNNW